ncbi:PEGA domain-containing protein [bacterium]|nr:PEGA domain-containing protein [bacterium]
MKAGFVAETQELQLDSSNKLVRIQMDRGQRLSFQAFARGVLATTPLQGVVVSIDGKPVGSTDKAGHFVHTFKGGASSRNAPLMKVELAPPAGFLPESAESEFAPVAGIHLVRHFAGDLAKTPIATIEESRHGSSTLDAAESALLVKATESAFDRNVFPRKVLARATRGQKHPDVRIRRSFSKKDSGIHAELVAVDAKGGVVGAARESIPSDVFSQGKAAALQKTVDALVDRLIRSLPFQGVVIEAGKGQLRALLPGQLASFARAGDRFDVFSTRYDPKARKQTFSNVATASVPSATSAAPAETAGEMALQLDGMPSGKPVAKGDILVFRGVPIEKIRDQEKKDDAKGDEDEPAPVAKTSGRVTSRATGHAASILVTNKSSDDPRPVQQANVYFNDVWVGTTNNNGVVYLPKPVIGSKGKISVAKAGWNPVALDAQAAEGRQIEVAMEPEASRLRVDSVPSGASVFLDGKVAGKTPLDTKLDGAGAFIKLEVSGPDGFKKYSSVIEVEAGTLDLTGQRSVQLEDDVVGNARKLSEAGKASEAISALSKVPPTHSDYLVSRHVAGEIALAKLNDPVKAEQFFAAVTAAPEVRDFIDKRFIGSHINHGIALHMIAEKMSRSNPKVAAENFAKAAAMLDRAARYTRFLPKKDFKNSVQNLEYFRALSFHRRWLLVNDPVALENANRGWRDYVGNIGAADESDKQSRVLADNARVYLKQTEAGLSRR